MTLAPAPIREDIQPMPPAWAIWFQALTREVNAGGSSVSPSVLLPLMDGVAALGSEGKYADGQHVHPTDTSRQATSTKLDAIAALANAPGALTNDGTGNFSYVVAAGTGTVTSVSVVSANGLAGTVATATSTPAITISTTVTGLLKGNGTAISAAVAGTDYLSSVLTSAHILVGNSSNVATSVALSGDAALSNTGVLGVNKTRLNVRNETGVTIASTRVVYITGFNNFPLIGLADNTDENKHDFIGLTIAPIADQANGFIATSGQCDAETNSWPVGTQLYFTTSGNVTDVEPTTGEARHIGIVTVQQNYPVGKILLYTTFEGNIRGVGAGAGIIDRLGDSIGATKWSLRNYANTEIFSIDSLGNITPPLSGASWTEVEVDFGSTPVYSKTFTVADGAVSGSSKVAVVPCGKVATGGSEDDWEWDGITFAANPGAGSFRVMAAAFPGPVAGKRKISYQVA